MVLSKANEHREYWDEQASQHMPKGAGLTDLPDEKLDHPVRPVLESENGQIRPSTFLFPLIILLCSAGFVQLHSFVARTRAGVR